MDGDYCPECSYQTWRIRFPGPNGICVWDVCTTCGMWYRVME